MNEEKRRELLDAYSFVEKAIKKFDNKQINKIVSDRKRTLAQIIYHIVYYENIYVTFNLRKLLFDYNLYIESFLDTDLTSKSFNVDEIEDFLSCLKKEREKNVFLLDKFYDAINQNKLYHEVHGELSIDDIIEKIITHDQHHCNQIKEILVILEGE